MPRRTLAVLALGAALLVGCGGGGNDDAPSTIGPDTTGAATDAAAGPTPDVGSVTEVTGGLEESTVTVDPEPFTEPQEEIPRPPFPAPDAAGVVALAMQQPPGKVTYDVAFPEGAYRLTLANDGDRGVVHQTQDTGDVWIGANVKEGSISFFCTALPDAPADCRSGDPQGTAVATAREIAQVVGADFIQRTFGPVAALPDVQVAADQQLAQPVSCLATTVEGSDLRLCATENGHVTEIKAGDTRALAAEVSDDVADGDLDPPAEPRG
jgi:hypothetical protein